MNKRLRIAALIIGLVLLTSLGIIIIFRFATGATVVVDVGQVDNITNVYVEANDKPVLIKNEQTKTFTIQNVRGDLTITVKAAGYKPYVMSEKYFWKETATVTPILEAQTAQEIAPQLNDGFDNAQTRVADAVYSSDSLWMAYRLYDANDPNSYPSSIIAKFDRLTGEWVVINFGTENEVEPIYQDTPIPSEIYREFIDANY